MRISYTKKEIRIIYKQVVKKAGRYCAKGLYEESIRCIRCAAHLQYQFNDILIDENLNKNIKIISDRIFTTQEKQKFQSGLYVFYDYAGLDNKGLTQQYLDAIFNIEGVSLLYIHETELTDVSKNVKRMLIENHAQIYELGNKSFIEKARDIHSILCEYKPEKIFCHLNPATSVPLLIALYAYPFSETYNINLTDHAFWLGGPDLFDYNFEFRKRGALLSLKQRGFKREQLLLLPYYPWYETTPFDGFPDGIEDSIKIFSGGALYKIEGADNEFLDIVRRILQLNNKIVFLYAGTGDTKYIDSFIKQNGLEKRFIYLGHRKDINEVLKHIDIFLGTYPIGGGLMTQYAALNAKPIVTYRGYTIETLLAPSKKMSFVFDSKESLVEEINELIVSPDYRKMKGEYYKTLIPSQKDFCSRFRFLITEHEPVDYSIEDKDTIVEDVYSSFINRINDESNLTIELPLFKATKSFLHWKVLLNMVLNFRKVIISVISKK